MENIVNHVERFRNFIRRWWLTLILGIAILALGVIVFVRPAETYLTLSVAFGIVILATGISDIFVGADAPKRTGRGWVIAAGVLETLLGIFVLCNPAILVALLPFMLGFWIMFRGFTMIGVASDMMDYGIKGAGWILASAILLVLLSVLIVFNPIIGAGLVVVWIGISLIVLGISMIIFSIYLNRLRKQLP